MKIELKNININQSMSEETYCYSAKLIADGKHIADVMNRGHGGPDEVRAKAGCEEALAAAEAHCKTLPPIHSHGVTLPMDLELVCGELVSEHLVKRDMQRALKTKILVKEPSGRIMEWRFKGCKQITQNHIDAIKAKVPEGSVILNELPEATALAIYRIA